MAIVAMAQTPAQTAPRTRVAIPLITGEIDESSLVILKGSVHPFATSEADQGAVSDSMQLGRTILMLKSSDAAQAALKKLVDDQQNPKSPSYHKWLKPEEFGRQFGAAPSDIQEISQWLESHGFQVEPVMPGRNLIMFSGTHAQLKAAFHTEIHSYKVKGQSYYANATDPQIPAALAPAVSGFSSLNSFPRYAQHTQPQMIRHDKSIWKPAAGTTTPRPQFTTSSQGQTLQAIGPYDLATIYNVKPLWDAGIDGTDQTIAIVSDSDINPADVDYFRTTFGLPAKKLNLIYYGPNPGPTPDEGEADLDVQWAGAVAKNATIDLVVAANSATSNGIDAAAAYIINNNLASILNVSYGSCELALGTQGNQYYSQIWEQAAAQGITVLAAAGDAGSAVCDDQQHFARFGLSVSGIASTPYNVAVGGTDFYTSFVNPGTYWNSTNDPTTLQSVMSYIPETPWNNSCASSDVFAVLQANGVTDATPEAVCNDGNEQSNFLTTAAGSGGASNCINGDQSSASSCSTGYAKPAWQSGVSGIPADKVRDLPDVSLMAGNGLWSTFYVYCQSDATPDGTCDVNNEIEGAGGTSFASPIFAGILALVQQKTASQQGNVNYVLYKLAASQYANSSNAASCSTATVAAGNACMFYDVTDGTNAVPCVTGTPNCTTSIATDQFGILSGYSAGSGYDLATGLGSVNAANLVNGWSSASTTFLPTSTQIAASGPTTAAYGTPINVNVVVAATAGSPSGDVGITTNSTSPNNLSVAEATLANGQAAIPANMMLGGTYQLFARYAGDATFASSTSTGLTVTITPAAVSGAVFTTSRVIVAAGQYVTLALSIPGVTNGNNPSGTATFTNTATGKVLGTGPVLASSSTTATPVSAAYVTVPASEFKAGANNITATYSGDSNYAAASATPTAVTLTGPFTASVNPGSLILGPNATGSVSVIATPSGETALNPSSLEFTCPSAMPVGLVCSFSAPVAANGGAVTSTLTLQLATPLYIKSQSVAATRTGRSGWLGAGAIASLAGLMMIGFPGRRRRIFPVLLMIAFSSLSFTIGCGGGSSPVVKAPVPLITTTTALSLSPTAPAFESPKIFTAKVTPGSGTGTPTGSVVFSSDSKSIGTANLTSGSATLSISSLPVGSQAITAAYGGDSTYAASTSSAGSVDITFTSMIPVTVTNAAGDTSSAQLSLTIQ